MDNLLYSVIASVVTSVLWMVFHNMDIRDLVEIIALQDEIISKQKELLGKDRDHE